MTNLVLKWELEVGKQYEVVLTTEDGLWHYWLGDIIEVIGFDLNNGFSIFVLSRQRCVLHHSIPLLQFERMQSGNLFSACI